MTERIKRRLTMRTPLGLILPLYDPMLNIPVISIRETLAEIDLRLTEFAPCFLAIEKNIPRAEPNLVLVNGQRHSRTPDQSGGSGNYRSNGGGNGDFSRWNALDVGNQLAECLMADVYST